MTFNQIKYVTEIAKVGSINKAAENLFISQSVLSSSIKRLEEELGKQVFYRTAKGVQLTNFGKTLLSYLEPIQLQLTQLDLIVNKQSQTRTNTLSISSNGYLFIDRLLSKLYWKYREEGIIINLIEDHGFSVMDYVANGSCELGFIRLWSCYRKVNLRQINSLKLQYMPIIDQRIIASVGPNSPLFKSTEDFVSIDELSKYPAIMYEPMDAGPYSDIYNRIGIKLRKDNKMVTNSRSTLYTLLNETDGFYLNSTRAHPNAVNTYIPTLKNTRLLFIKDCPVYSELGWIKQSGKDLSPLASEIVENVTEFMLGQIDNK